MATAFQNRLVGTVILVALAVIFLPDILDGEKVSNKDVFVDIPAKPIGKPMMQHEDFPLEQVKKASVREIEVIDEQPVDDPVEASAEAADDNPQVADVNDFPVADSAPQQAVTAGWVIQLGSFRHQKNVRELLNKLESAGYRAFSRQVSTSAGELTKVFVGPDLQKNKLEQALPHLNELTSLKGKVMEFGVE